MNVDRAARTQLHYAALEGDLKTVQDSLAAGADPCLPDNNGYTPLHFAAQSSSPEVISCLIESGVPVDTEDMHGNTPLWTATFNDKNGQCVRLLLEAGADPDHVNEAGATPRSLAETIADSAALHLFENHQR